MVLVASQRHAGRFPAPCWSRCSALLIASRYRNCYASASASSRHPLIVVLPLHLTCLLMELSTDSLFTSTALILQRVSPHRSIRMITSSIRRSLSACRARSNDTTGNTGAQRSAGPCSHQFHLLHTSRFHVLLPASVRTPRIVYSFLVPSFRTIITRHALSRTATSLSSRFLFSGPCFWFDSLPVHASCALTPETSPHSSIGSVHALSLALGSSIRSAASLARAFAFSPPVDRQFLQISPQLHHSTRDYPAAFLCQFTCRTALSFHAPALLHATIRRPFTRSSLDARSPFTCRACAYVRRLVRTTHVLPDTRCFVLPDCFLFFSTDSFTRRFFCTFVCKSCICCQTSFTCFVRSGLLQPFGAPCAAGHSLPLLLNILALHTAIFMHSHCDPHAFTLRSSCIRVCYCPLARHALLDIR